MRKLKKISIIALCLAGANPAFADEANWTGPYAGVYVGHSNTSTDFEDNWCWATCDAPRVELNTGTGGVTLGYNLQVDPSFMVGVEADLGTGGSKTLNTPNIRGGVGESFAWRSKIKWSSTIRLRAGLVHGKTVAYVTGGYALADADIAEETKNYPVYPPHSANWGAQWSGTLKGYSYGAGVEHDFGGITAKAEFIRTSYGKGDKCLSNSDGPLAGECWTSSVGGDPTTIAFTPSSTAIRLGVNLNF